jgi:PAS domain S-box-containing protein
MPSASLPQRISKISEELKTLRAKSMSHTEEATETLQDGLEQLQISLKELTALVNGTTETERAEEALSESEHLYRTLFNSIDDGFVLVEPIFDEAGNSDDYRMLEVNDAWERQTGLKAADLVGKRIRGVLPNVENVWPATFAEVARTGDARHFESYNANSGRWYDLYAFPYKKGQVGVMFRDITERKRAEEKLRESEERFRAVQENSLDRFTILKPFYDDQGEIIDFTYVYQNAQAARTAGRRPEELVHHGLNKSSFMQ